MKVAEALRGVSQLGLDTAPIIYFVENHPVYLPICQPFFDAIQNGSLQTYTSTATLIETLVQPLRRADAIAADKYRTLLLSTFGITSLALSVEIAERAADLRSRYNLRLPDAVQVATAMEAGCDAFLTKLLGSAKSPYLFWAT